MVKQSSGIIVASSIVHTGKCLYYGFVVLPGNSDRIITIYDGVTAVGTIVESFVGDANKPTDGHSHSNPVLCTTGIYVSLSGGSVVVYYADLLHDVGLSFFNPARLAV